MDTYSHMVHFRRVNLKGPLKNMFYMIHLRSARHQSINSISIITCSCSSSHPCVCELTIYLIMKIMFPMMMQRLKNVLSRI